MAQLFSRGSDLAEWREMQSGQGAVEHIPHCSQQPQAGKHLVEEVRERLLQAEQQQLEAGGPISPHWAGLTGTAASTPCVRILEGLVQGCVTSRPPQSPTATTQPWG